MAHWLKSVNNLLEKLDDRAETAAAERSDTAEDDKNAGDIHIILAKRGLGPALRDEEDDEGRPETEAVATEWQDSGLDFDDAPQELAVEAAAESRRTLEPETLELGTSVAPAPEGVSVEKPLQLPNTSKAKVLSEPSVSGEKEAEKSVERAERTACAELTAEAETAKKTAKNPSGVTGANETEAINNLVRPKQPMEDTKTPDEKEIMPSLEATGPNKEPSQPTEDSSIPHPHPEAVLHHKAAPRNKAAPPKNHKKSPAAEAKEAQKEARTLRRHVVSLNAQLEAAEGELRAQRKELELAAERIEKDRKKQKDGKEAAQRKHAEEMKTLRTQHQNLLTEQQAIFNAQIAGFKATLEQVEDRRKEEGGNMNKEMAQLEEREQEMSTRIGMLEEEKSILLSQITTLQGQQSALGSRLESLTEAADNAMAREREAEDRLDSVLTQHARQIGQRQTREADLERTISELNSALVVAKGSNDPKPVPVDNEVSTRKTDDSFMAKIETLQQDLETANSHLTLERERSGALHKQLREMSRESTQEASAVHAKQVHYDRKIAEMSLTISKLEATVREAQCDAGVKPGISDSDSLAEDTKSERIAVLSEEVFRLRDKIASHNSESLALKNRLQSAVDRAKKAEDQLSKAATNGNSDFNSLELGGFSNGLDRRRRRGANQASSIRSVMQLEAGQGERREQLGRVVDVVDSFAVTTGKYLKRNPIARAGFIFYLVLIHLWTFVLLFVHAHSFEEHSDFGAVAPHGPHALMRQAPQANLVASQP